MQRVPELNIIPHDGEEVICEECGESVTFLIEGMQNKCKSCFGDERPEYSDAIADFAELLDLLHEMKERMMSQEEMHELYGKEETDTER